MAVKGETMREIKFRAWDGKQIHYGLGFYPMLDGKYHIVTGGKEYICDNLMQYTGIKTQKGVEIYDGDIVYIAGIGNCKVLWDNSDACWLFDLIDPVRLESFGYQDVIEDLESVIGNIYENKDLLCK